MSFSVVQLSVGTLLLLAAAFADVWKRRIPNVLTVMLGAAGVWAQAAQRGWLAAVGGLGAALLMVALLWLPWMKGRLGGGDVKTAAACGVWMGFSALPEYVLVTAVMGGIVATGCYLLSSLGARRQIRANLASVVARVSVPEVSLRGDTGRVSVPYGLAVALGGLAVLWTGGRW